MQDEVFYLGFKINKNRLFPVKEKLVMIKNAEEPKNVSELKLFLGLLNYYHRHLLIHLSHSIIFKGGKVGMARATKNALEKAKKNPR